MAILETKVVNSPGKIKNKEKTARIILIWMSTHNEFVTDHRNM